MNEECIIRKLIADGDGGGDDRRFATILALLLKYFKDFESSQSIVPRIMKMMEAAETAMKKQALISTMNEQQIQEYIMLTSHIEQELIKENQEKFAAKRELVVAKGQRKNKEEYELLAKMIEKVPSRSESTRKLDLIKKELEELHEKQRNLETKLAERRNHLHSLNIILTNFCKFLKDEENGEIMNNDDAVDGTGTDGKKEKA
ncbi:IL5 receptor binding protein, putative [Brugia malayi]|uniref:Bm8757 n=4 Tax=Brugia TaxID=6278 RepID=A0A0H5S297_BRUMA|nr:IL5 receptor binding protein, putative [Brugia malayi]CRZ22741.1 Bm8757 [Brugia malayi]VDO36257.1 unnamed protein product [Brugia timori]VIO88267.1 IL5 receptor binding protein, putative [Brugia malayi]